MELRPSQRYAITQEKLKAVAMSKRIGPILCSECNEETDKPVKNKCRKCYSRLKAQEKANIRKEYYKIF